MQTGLLFFIFVMMRKKVIFLLLCVASLSIMMSCQSNDKKLCRIHGVMESSRWNEKQIFLVPMFGPQDSEHVDSVVIKDGSFEFVADTTEMKVIRVDYHFRDGAQELLVVSEPGDVYVKIGANSTSHGTPQNDSLQVWKEHIERFNSEYNALRAQAHKDGNGNLLMTKGKEIQRELREYNAKMRENMKSGVFYDFLKNR